VSCPICAKEVAQKYHPFCSRRCADVDLGKWLTGAYAIAAEPLEPDMQDSEDNDKPARQ
jgi:endogenous inhibitor of DNA gyrase (YacG/DUF329 family)